MEEQIVEKLKQNIPQPTESAVPAPLEVKEETDKLNNPIPILDELYQYKMHQYLDDDYNPLDITSNNQVQYIYEKIAQMIGTIEYGEVITKIHELRRMIGMAHNDRQVYKLYEWLRLNTILQNTRMEMGAYSG